MVLQERIELSTSPLPREDRPLIRLHIFISARQSHAQASATGPTCAPLRSRQYAHIGQRQCAISTDRSRLGPRYRLPCIGAAKSREYVGGCGRRTAAAMNNPPFGELDRKAHRAVLTL